MKLVNAVGLSSFVVGLIFYIFLWHNERTGEMYERIIKFIKKHHVLTVATCVDSKPWTANCFYAYMEEENCFVFTTDDDTRHGREFEINPNVAGSVVLETKVIGKIRGIQFEGIVSKPDDSSYKKIKNVYLKRFPVAMLMDTNLWVLKLTHVKLTDNRLGFGTKLVWDDANGMQTSNAK